MRVIPEKKVRCTNCGNWNSASTTKCLLCDNELTGLPCEFPIAEKEGVSVGLVIGALIGGIVGFILRPALPFIGQLPFGMVITGGSQLTGLDRMLIGSARESLTYLVGGVIVGAIIGVFASTSAKLKRSTSAYEKQCPYCAESIKAEATVCRFCKRDIQEIHGD